MNPGMIVLSIIKMSTWNLTGFYSVYTIHNQLPVTKPSASASSISDVFGHKIDLNFCL